MPGPDATALPQADRVLGGRYRLVRPLARGGMAEVWEGYDDVLARAVALKMLLAHLATDGSLVERFRREAVAAARLSHPGVVATYDTGTDAGTAWIVMELVRGHNLRQLLNERGPMEPPMAVDITAQIADALAHAHRAGLVHRDIKPANVLLVEEDAGYPRAKVTDFGIAKATEGLGLDLTRTGMVLGTPKYLSPEQVEGREPDARADLYSLGVVLFEMLTCRVPFEGPTDMATAIAHLRQPAPRLSACRPDVSPELDQLVADLLAKDPASRPPSAVELRRALAWVPTDTRLPAAPLWPEHSSPAVTPSSFSLAGLAGPSPPPPGPPPLDSASPSSTTPSSWPPGGSSFPPAGVETSGGDRSGGRGSLGDGSFGRGSFGRGSFGDGSFGDGSGGSGAGRTAATARAPTTPAPRIGSAPGAPATPELPPDRSTSFGSPSPPPAGPGAVDPSSALSGPVGRPGPLPRVPVELGLPRYHGGPSGTGPRGDPTAIARRSGPPTVVQDDRAPSRGQPPSRRRRRRWAPGLVVGVLVVVGCVVTYVLLSGSKLSDGTGTLSHPPKAPGVSGSSIPAKITSVTIWMTVTVPESRLDNPGETPLTFDGNPDTAWSTDLYRSATFGGLYGGEGLAIHLNGTHVLHQLEVDSQTVGWAAQTYVADREPDGGQPVSAWGQATDTKTDIQGSATFDLGGRSGSWVLFWLTNLGPSFQAEVAELDVS